MGKFIKRSSEFCITFVVSPELLIILVAILVGNQYGNDLIKVIPDTVLRPEVVKWASSLPVCLGVFSFTNWKELLSPEHKNNHLLAEWPDRDLLTIRFYVGIIYQAFFLLVAVFFWVCDPMIKTQYGLPFFVFAILGSIVSVATHYVALIQLRLILDAAKTSHETQRANDR